MITVIIPCRKAEEAQLCVQKCRELSRKDIEVIVLTDDYTGKVSPATKRNIGIKKAQGEIIAFIDADAYPDKWWLNYVVENAGGWCGPGLIPPNSPMRERATDWILRCMPFNYRVSKKKVRYVDDYPTFNLIIPKKTFDLVGNFNENTLTGEDSDLCQRITKLGLKIVYIPQCIVYHKRRPLFLPFLKQVATYAIHRGNFFRKGKGSSRKLVYCLPSICLLLSISLLVILWLF